MPYPITPNWPPVEDDLTTCPACKQPFGPQANFRVELLGFRQVTPGQDAVELADCVYLCGNCGIRAYIRVQRSA